MPNDSGDSIEPLASSYTKSATLPYEELDQLKAATATATGKSLMVRLCCCLNLTSFQTEGNINGCQQSTGVCYLKLLCLFGSRRHVWITSG